MAHSCTELWPVSAQPHGARARPTPWAWKSCLQQDLRGGGTTGNAGGQAAPDPAPDTQTQP